MSRVAAAAGNRPPVLAHGNRVPAAVASSLVAATPTVTADGTTTDALTVTIANSAGTPLQGVQGTITAAFVNISLASSFTTSGASILDDGIETALATAIIVSTETGLPMIGFPYTSGNCTSTGSNNTITAVGSVTDSTGRAQWTIASTTAQTKTLTATIGGVALTGAPTVVVTGSDTWLANLPGGAMVELTDRDFSSAGDLNDPGSRGSAANVTDATAPYSPTKVARFVYAAGAAAGFGTGQASNDAPDNTVRVYFSFNLRLSSNYTVNPGNQKIVYLFRTTDQSNGSMVLGILPGAGESNYTSGTLRWNLQTQTSDATRYGSAIVRDTWYHVEMLAIMNTVAGTANGVFKTWINGTLDMDYSNVLFTDTGGVMKWRDVAIDAYYGGNVPGHTIPSECYIYVDHWTAYTDTARS